MTFTVAFYARLRQFIACEAGVIATELLVPGATQLKALREKAGSIHATLKGLNAKATAAMTAGGPALTDEERASVSTLKAQFDEVEGLRLEAEGLNEQERRFGHVEPNPDVAASTEAQRLAGLQPKPPEPVAFGRFLQHVRAAATPGGSVHPSIQAAATGLNETVPSEGGFLVQQERASTIRERVYEVGQLLKRVNHIPLSANSNGILLPAIDETSRADGSRHGGIRAYWVAEAGEKTASKPKFRLLDLKLKKLAALVYATDELLQDSVALEAWTMSHLPDELTFKAEDAIVSGTGAGQPLGFLNSGASISVTRTTTGAIKYEDIVNMWARLYAPSRKNAIWLIDQGAEAQLFSMSLAVGVGGVPVYMPAGGVAGAPHSTLFGRPIVTSEYGAALGTVGDIMLIDPSQYAWIDKGGIQNAVSIHVRFIYDESVFRFVWRVDGAPEWNSALSPKSGGSTTSPYVLLAT